MILNKIKKLIASLLTGVVIIFAAIGGYQVYREFKPIEVTQTQSNVVRISLEAHGILKVASSKRVATGQVVGGKTELFQTTYSLSRECTAAYEYDLGDVTVLSDIDNKVVTIEIDPTKLQLRLEGFEDKENIDTTLIAPVIKDTQIKKLKETLKEELWKKFVADEEFKKTALNSLMGELYKIAKSMGFDKIDIKIIE